MKGNGKGKKKNRKAKHEIKEVKGRRNAYGRVELHRDRKSWEIKSEGKMKGFI